MTKLLKNKLGKTHLVIPDLHAHPDYDNERAAAIGRLIVSLKPDVVVCLGDFGDFPSLCSYDKGTRSFEGRRYKRDLAAFHDAMNKLMEPIKKSKKKLPEFHFITGNHEQRLERVAELEPTLDGIVSLADLKLDEYGWEVHPFLKPASIDGILYCHYFVSGVMNRPIGGVHLANSLLTKGHVSATMGHTHTRSFAEATTFEGKVCTAVVAGACIDFPQEWTSPQVNNMYWNGVLIKRNVREGQYDLEWVSLDSLMSNYNPEAVEKRGVYQTKETALLPKKTLRKDKKHAPQPS